MSSARDLGCTVVLFVLLAPVIASWLPWWEFQGELQLGIDLGTTFSVAAICSGGRAQAVTVDVGGPLLASVAAYNSSGAPVIGAEAAELRATAPMEVVYDMKRIIGRHISDPYVAAEQEAVPYSIVEGPGGRAAVQLSSRPGQLITPEEVGGHVLSRLKDAAERSSGYWHHLFGFRFYTATITVPISFDGPQRTRTQEAAKRAGFRMVRLIEEPVAAAAAYGLDKGGVERHVLVYDMGGGTLDVALLRLQPDTRTFLVMATAGDPRLGGEDFDRALADMVLKRSPPPGEARQIDPATRARLLRSVEAAKRALSQDESASFQLPWGGAETLRRSDIEEACGELLERALAPVDAVLSQDLVDESAVEVVLAGGSSRLVAVRERLTARFGSGRIHATLDADLAIALGASKAFGC